MKTLIIVLLFACPAIARADQYVEAMQQKIQLLYAAQNAAEYQEAINTLQRIGQAEKTKWEPYYYVSFGYIMMATDEQDGAKKDAYLDLAKTALDNSVTLRPDDSELTTLQGFIYTIRITVDTQTRGPQFAGLAMQAYQKALTQNPANPRAMLMLAQIQFGTARFFKQEPKEACDSVIKAVALFSTDKSDNPLAPVWGKKSAEELAKNCL